MNKELNSCGIILSYNILNTELLETAGETQTQIPFKTGYIVRSNI